MGLQFIATCKCGLSSTISIGGGRFSFKEFFYIPCLCTYCNRVVQVNFMDNSLACLDCEKENTVPYNKSSLEGIKEKY